MDAEKEMQELKIMPQQENVQVAPRKRRRKKTTVVQPSKQVDKEEHYSIGEQLPVYLI